MRTKFFRNSSCFVLLVLFVLHLSGAYGDERCYFTMSRVAYSDEIEYDPNDYTHEQRKAIEDYARAFTQFDKVKQKKYKASFGKGKKSPPSLRQQKSAAKKLDGAKEGLLIALEIPYRAVHTKYGRRLVILPSRKTALGRFVLAMDKSSGTKVIIPPGLQRLEELTGATWLSTSNTMDLSDNALVRVSEDYRQILSVAKPVHFEIHEAIHRQSDRTFEQKKAGAPQGYFEPIDAAFPELRVYSDGIFMDELWTFPIEAYLAFEPLRKYGPLFLESKLGPQTEALQAIKLALIRSSRKRTILENRFGDPMLVLSRELTGHEEHYKNIDWIKSAKIERKNGGVFFKTEDDLPQISFEYQDLDLPREPKGKVIFQFESYNHQFYLPEAEANVLLRSVVKSPSYDKKREDAQTLLENYIIPKFEYQLHLARKNAQGFSDLKEGLRKIQRVLPSYRVSPPDKLSSQQRNELNAGLKLALDALELLGTARDRLPQSYELLFFTQ